MVKRKERAVALIDGEHYPDVTTDTLRYLEDERGYRIVALVFLGGTEKIADLSKVGFRDVPVYRGTGQVEDLGRALREHRVEVVLDLSDEPVAGYRQRFLLISEALARGVSYIGPDFVFEAPERPHVCVKPVIGIWGSGKRVGKTAVSGFMAGHLADGGIDPCVLTMGRGGPARPEVLSSPEEITDGYLRGRVAEGLHAASDHFEDAMTTGVLCIGCRRCGGGMAGEPMRSNVREGALLTADQPCDIVIAEGSGAAIPPVGTDSVLLVASAAQPIENLLGYLGPYRLLQSDVVVVTMCEEFLVSSDKLRRLIDGIQSINPEVKVVEAVFRPRPLSDIEGKRVFLASTAQGEAVEIQKRHLESDYGATVTGISSNLADRVHLREDLDGAGDMEVLATEIKAAGVDTVSTYARDRGKELVYIENRPVSVGGNLEDSLDYLVALARERFSRR